MKALSLLASFLALWAGTAMLLSRLPWFRDSVRLAERLAPYAPNVEASWTDEVERWAPWATPGRGEAWVRSSGVVWIQTTRLAPSLKVGRQKRKRSRVP